jgi:hypothetical protein
MAIKDLNKTYSTYSQDQLLNRANEVRRDNDIIKTPKCTIEDVDWALMSFIRDEIKPQVIENGQIIDVPIMYANGEKWAQIQARGYMRDRKGKLMTPLISIRRGTIVERDTLKSLGVNNNPSGNDFIYRNKNTRTNQYDRFSVLQGIKPSKEYYAAPVPEFVDVSYEILLWTEYTEQMNTLVEQIMPTNGFAYGTTWKFPTYLQDVTFDTTNASGEDRIVRATIPMTTKAALLMPFELQRSNFQKRFSVKKVVFENEIEKFDVDVVDGPPGGYEVSTSPTPPTQAPVEKSAQRDQNITGEQGIRQSRNVQIKNYKDYRNRWHAPD